VRKTFTAVELLEQTTMTVSGCMEWNLARNSDGYGKKWDGEKVRSVHRIICEIYKGPREKMQVMHSCDNPPCINPDHLRWGTQKDNVEDMISKNRQRWVPSHGEKHGRAKLSEDDVRNIRKARREGMLLREISEKHGTSIRNISRIISGKLWKGIGNDSL